MSSDEQKGSASPADRARASARVVVSMRRRLRLVGTPGKPGRLVGLPTNAPGKILHMADHDQTTPDADDPVDRIADPMTRLSVRAGLRDQLAAQLAEVEQRLRADAVEARRGGELVGDIQRVAGWSHEKLNQVLRAGGIQPDRSAPRKRRT